MISSIRNPWIRRPLVVLASVIFIPALLLASIIGALWETAFDICDCVAAAWRGSTRGR